MSKQKIKIPENRVFLIKGGRNLTRWTPTSRTNSAVPCQMNGCFNSFQKQCQSFNGIYGPDSSSAHFTSYCACVNGYFGNNCSIFDCISGCKNCVSAASC